MLLPSDHAERLARARIALDGLSVGDAFGERFFGDRGQAEARVARRELPAGTWRWTDDTAMGCAVFQVLAAKGRIDPDELADRFVRIYRRDPARGYGSGAHQVLQAVAVSGDWRRHSTGLFRGGGSYGNGGAMRVAPLGAYFCDDLDRLVPEAEASARVTHAHPEGVAGAIAAAVATALAWQCREDPEAFRARLFPEVLARVPPGEVRDGIARAATVPRDAPVASAVARLGNGERISAADTVPITLWVAHRHAGTLEDGLWTMVSAWGDRDTTTAIVGGILAAFQPPSPAWLAHREPLAGWIPESGG